MKKGFQLLFIALTISLLLSCDKNKGNTVITGQVLEKGSNKPVANAKVIFSQCVVGDGTFSPSVCTDVETILTDANGNFTFTKEEDDTDEYRIRAEKENYGKTVEVFQTAPAGEKTKNIRLTLPAFAWIKFHVKNVNPFDKNDLIIAPGASGAGLEYRFYGINIDTSYILGNKNTGNLYLGAFKNKIWWSVTKQNLKTVVYDSIFCKPIDTVFYEIKY